MAMDKLKSEQDRLCQCLSRDPDYILDKCGDFLLLNEFREVQKQSHALEKMTVLLKIIIKKEEAACQSFIDVLREHQTHYPQLQEFFNPNTQGSHTPTVVADGSSIVSTREITNMKGKSLSVKFEVTGAGNSQSRKSAEQLPQADYTANTGSIICADKICNVTIDGDIDLSATVKSSHQACAGTVDETPPSSQGPAVKMIRDHKVELIATLRADCSFILQHVHARSIVTDREYHNLKDISQSEKEKVITDLIDLVIDKGQAFCSRLLTVLKEPEILSTYPQLKCITRNCC